jgi:exoribonuclease R
MIEECVMSASAKVGEYLFKNLKSKAILYRHRFPGLKKLNKFQNSLKKMGQSLPEGSVEIQKFINEIITNGQIKQCIKDTIKYQAIKLL